VRVSALTGAGLVLCATGAVSRRGEDLPHLRNGAYVATVTSSEDELELTGLPEVYTRTMVGDHVTRYQTTGHYFYQANGGNAVNFLHGASVGPFIVLVQAEILGGIRMLTRGDLTPGMQRGSRPRSCHDRGHLALLLQQVIDLAITADHIRTTLTAYLDAHPEDETLWRSNGRFGPVSTAFVRRPVLGVCSGRITR
jgi:hypothetical protein